MTHRDRFVNTVLGLPVDRVPYYLFWRPWETTWARWEREGKPADLRTWEEAKRWFGADPKPLEIPVNCGPCPRREKVILDEGPGFVVYRDTWGVMRRNLTGRTSMSEFLSFPVRERSDWERYRDEWLDPGHPQRLTGDWREKCAAWSAAGMPLSLGYFPDVGLFGGLRWLLGDEECLIAFCEQPDLVHEIMDHLTTVYLAVFQKVVEAGVRVDRIHIWEDMCGRQGPLISPAQFGKFMLPCYRRIAAFAQQNAIPIISLDTDGDPDLLAPGFMAGGVNLLYPMEVAAGCDVNQWRARYPRLGMLGGIDKRALAAGRAAIDRELERVRPALRAGRYIPDLDHQVPDDVSWDDFCYYARQLRGMVVGGRQ